MKIELEVNLGSRTANLLERLIEALEKSKNVPSEDNTVEVRSAISNKQDIKKVVEPNKKVEETIEDTPSAEVETTKDVVETHTKDDIRLIARELADASRNSEYKPILAKYGYEKVNQIKDEHIEAIYTEMKALLG